MPKKILDFFKKLWYNKDTKNKGEKIMDKREKKMDAKTLQQFLAFRKRASKVPSKKGKGSYSRKDFKKEVA